uniref:Secreted RxLR effector protein 41 n=1 Tax=Plasmopara viticola TaxID=143451 RepID=RLR41_PLAVT|nr:RecName: Full=Secreted RxLR effector protein 41; Flags: Precursor [Plasmopara viticola]
MLGFVTGVLAISAHVIVSQPNEHSPVVVARETYGLRDVIFRRLRSYETDTASARAEEGTSDIEERSDHEIPPDFYKRLASTSTPYVANLSHKAQIAAQALRKDAERSKGALELLKKYAELEGKMDAPKEEKNHVDRLKAAAFKEWNEKGLNLDQVRVLFADNKRRTSKYENLIEKIVGEYEKS